MFSDRDRTFLIEAAKAGSASAVDALNQEAKWLCIQSKFPRSAMGMLDPVIVEKLNMNISDLDLSVRARNCLLRGRIFSVFDLAQRTEIDLRKIPCMGLTGIREIKRFLAGIGLVLGMDFNAMALKTNSEKPESGS